MRLIPNAADDYQWEPVPGKEYLFTKHLSKLSIGPLMELCREVGQSFRAVRRGAPAGTCTSTANSQTELEKMRQERAALVCSVKRRLKGYQREYRKLRLENEQQKALIVKYKAMVQGLLQDGPAVPQ